MTKNNLLFILCVLSLFYKSAKAQNVFEGRIGKSIIYLQLDSERVSSGHKIVNHEGAYFYTSSLRDIRFQGEENKDSIVLYVHSHDNTFDEKFTLKRLTPFILKGKWQDSKGHFYPIILEKVDDKNFVNSNDKIESIKAIKKDSLFDYIRSSFFVFKTDSITTTNNKSFVWMTEKYSRVTFFRLYEGFEGITRNKINTVLTNKHIEMVNNVLTNSSDLYYNNSKDYDPISYNISLDYVTNVLLGFEIHSYWDCCGAHPDDNSEEYLFDLKTGKRYDLNDIIAFDKSVVVSNDKNFDTYSKYQEKYFAPKILEVIKNTPSYKENSQLYTECNYTDLDVWEFLGSWKITKDGFILTPLFPHVDAPCRNEFLVPFKLLAKYKHPNFPYILGKD